QLRSLPRKVKDREGSGVRCLMESACERQNTDADPGLSGHLRQMEELIAGGSLVLRHPEQGRLRDDHVEAGRGWGSPAQQLLPVEPWLESFLDLLLGQLGVDYPDDGPGVPGGLEQSRHQLGLVDPKA